MLSNERSARLTDLPAGCAAVTVISATRRPTRLTTLTGQTRLITLTRPIAPARLTAVNRQARLITLTRPIALARLTAVNRQARLVAVTGLAGLTGLIAVTGQAGRRIEQVSQRRFLLIAKLGSRVRDAQAVHQRQQILIRQHTRPRGRPQRQGLLRRLVRAGGGRAWRADCLGHPATSPAVPAPTLNGLLSKILARASDKMPWREATHPRERTAPYRLQSLYPLGRGRRRVRLPRKRRTTAPAICSAELT